MAPNSSPESRDLSSLAQSTLDLTRVEALPPLPARRQDGHKGTFGSVIVVGGCMTMIGAPALAATAAFRTGTGLVKVAAPANLLHAILQLEPSSTGILIDHGDAVRSIDRLNDADPRDQAVLAVGPGLSVSPELGRMLDGLLRGPRTLVLDADGLNLLAMSGRPRPVSGPPLVLTPHPGEFTRLARPLRITEDPTDPATRPAAAARLALAHRAVVVLKGHRTIVSDGTRYFINFTGNPAMATAGCGDVLTGMVAALLVQGMNPFDAAVLGAHLHGAAGDRWSAAHGLSGLLARDLASLIPDAMQAQRQLRASG